MAYAVLALTGVGLLVWPAGAHLRRWRCRWRTQHDENKLVRIRPYLVRVLTTSDGC